MTQTNPVANTNNSTTTSLTRDIKPLEGQIQPLKDKDAFWDAWYIRSVGIAGTITALAIIGTFLVQWHARRTRVSYERTQQRLDTLKERRSQLALRAADLRADKLDHDTAVLKKSNLELEAEIAPRRLSPRQKKELSELGAFAGKLVGIRSYAADTEAAILATQILEDLKTSKIRIEDNLLTMLPSAHNVVFGVSVEGTDDELVKELKRILSLDGNLTVTSALPPFPSGVSVGIQFGVTNQYPPPVATVTVGPKPIK